MNESLMSLLCATVISAAAVPAHASGCMGPEFSYLESNVMNTSLFHDTVRGHEVYMTSTVGGPVGVRIRLYTESLVHKGTLKNYWHDMELKGAVPYTLTPSALEGLLAIAQLEIVEDLYHIDCAYSSQGRVENLRLFVNYQGIQLEFRTEYMPDAD